MKSSKYLYFLLLGGIVFFLFGGWLLHKVSMSPPSRNVEEVNPEAYVNPAKKYVLEVWDEAYPNKREEGLGEKYLKQIISEFQKKYPNVTVNYRLLPAQRAEEQLDAALDKGTPPDVYGGTLSGEMLASGLLIPIDNFLSQNESTLYEEAALESVRYQGKLYAWPRWLILRPWIGDKIVLFEKGVDIRTICQKGWTQADFLALAAALAVPGEEEHRRFGFLPYALGGEFFSQLMLATGAGPAISKDGEFAWSKKDLEDAAAFICKIRATGSCPKQAASKSRDFLQLLQDKRVVICGPIGLWVYDLFPNRANNLIVLPVPTPKGNKLIPVEVSSVAVFRQREYRGDDQTRLAMEFASLYSRGIRAWVPTQMRAVPAYKPDQMKWGSVPWLQGTNRSVILDSGGFKSYSRLSPKVNLQKEKEIAEEIIDPAVAELWKGQLKPEEFAKQVRTGAKMILARP